MSRFSLLSFVFVMLRAWNPNVASAFRGDLKQTQTNSTFSFFMFYTKTVKGRLTAVWKKYITNCFRLTSTSNPTHWPPVSSWEMMCSCTQARSCSSIRNQESDWSKCAGGLWIGCFSEEQQVCSHSQAAELLKVTLVAVIQDEVSLWLNESSQQLHAICFW